MINNFFLSFLIDIDPIERLHIYCSSFFFSSDFDAHLLHFVVNIFEGFGLNEIHLDHNCNECPSKWNDILAVWDRFIRSFTRLCSRVVDDHVRTQKKEMTLNWAVFVSRWRRNLRAKREKSKIIKKNKRLIYSEEQREREKKQKKNKIQLKMLLNGMAYKYLIWSDNNSVC